MAGPADGHLRKGADELVAGKLRPDGLLRPYGPDDGGTGDIFRTGTVTTIAVLESVETLVDAGGVVSVVVVSGTDTLVDSGTLSSTASPTVQEAIADRGDELTVAAFAGDESIVDSGTVTTVVALSRGGYDEGEVVTAAILTGDGQLEGLLTPPPSPPAWSSIGRPTPRRPRQRQDRVVLSPGRTLVRSQSRVRVRASDSARTRVTAYYRVTAYVDSGSAMSVPSSSRLQAQVTSAVALMSWTADMAATRADSRAMEELLLLELV